MPTNDSSLHSTEDPYFNAADAEELSAYEREVQRRQTREAQEAVRQRIIDAHRSEIDEACELRGERLRVEERVRRFETDSSFRSRVSAARKVLGVLAFTVGIGVLIFFADLFLATPDLAEDLAHPVMSLIPASWLGSVAEDAGASMSTPNWLRLTLGVVLSLVALALTVTVKVISDETPVLLARRRLGAGDRQGWRLISRQLWTKRAVKFAYLLVMFGAFSWLYSYAEKRAEVMESLASQSTEELNWETLGGSILPSGQAETKEATPAPDAHGAITEVRKGGSLALGAAAIYAMLFILHAVLLMLPMPQSTLDLPLAKFNPHRAEKQAAAMRGREATLLRGIVARIQTTPAEDPLRTTLINLSEPVAPAVNELFNRVIMPLPAPEPPVQSSFTFDAESEEVVDHPEPTSPERGGPNDGRPPRIPDDMEDPGRIIFG